VSAAETFSKAQDLYVDVGAGGDNPIVAVTDTSSNESVARSMVQGQNRPLHIYFGVRGSGVPWSPRALEAGDVISVTGKLADAPTDVLFFEDNFIPGGTSENPYYSGTLAMNGESLNEAIGTAASIKCKVDIRVVGVTGTKYVAQYEVTVRRRVHEDTPPEPDQLPSYLTETESDARYQARTLTGEKIVTASDGKERTAYLFPDDVWRVSRPVIVEGQPTLTWEVVS